MGLYLHCRWIRKIGLLWGYVWRFGGSDGGPHGPRWPIYVPMAWMKWVEKKDGCHWRFLGERTGYLPTLKVDKENRVALGVCMAVLGV